MCKSELRVLRVGGWAGNRLATASDDCHVAVLSMAAGKPELEATRKVYASPLVALPQAAFAVAPLPLAWRVPKGRCSELRSSAAFGMLKV